MIKSFVVQQNQAAALEENMSNLTSASNEASASSISRNDSGGLHPQQYNFAAPILNQPQPNKKKRNLPGNPDPDAEVIALSPKTLMATNRFVCEICNKGFQRDQNLQLHRRGHNLPWKLKQRTSKEIRKKVYVCPEVNCVHHDPSRALGDLTGIKKHFCRKHGEKKWKCDKCSKRYAVQSDWKAHSKTCGTREYRCDCGTLFSRRDSFITHRAFCDALAEESTRTIGGNNPPFSSPTAGSSSSQHVQFTPTHDPLHNIFPSLKKEQQTFTLRPPEIPPWLACPSQNPQPITDHLNPSIFQELGDNINMNNSNPSNINIGPNLPHYIPPTSPHISATALLQKAAQMGATMSIGGSKTSSLPAMLGAHKTHESVNNSTSIGFGTVDLSSREDQLANNNSPFVTGGLVGAPCANKAAAAAGAVCTGGPSSVLQDMIMTSLSSSATPAATGFEGPVFEESFGGKNSEFHQTTFSKGSSNNCFDRRNITANVDDSGVTTRDFLGLRPLSQSDIFLNIANLGNCMNASTQGLGTWPHEH